MGRRRKRGRSRPSGIVVIDKPPGLSSFDVVRRVRGKLAVQKAGHTGTLDPLATGVLPICINEATKLAGLLLADEKVYTAELELGWRSDTFDRLGTEVSRGEGALPGLEQVEVALDAFRGKIKQRPPAYSALKKDGRRAYELARKGEAVALDVRDVEIFSLTLTRWAPPRVELSVHCSKGTYIRSLANDLGVALGCGAVLSELRRTRSGNFEIEQAVALTDLDQGVQLLPLSVALEHLPAVHLERADALRIVQGQPVPVALLTEDPVRIECAEMVFALGHVRDGLLHPHRVMPTIAVDLGLVTTPAEPSPLGHGSSDERGQPDDVGGAAPDAPPERR